jgi:hypothetical protein
MGGIKARLAGSRALVSVYRGIKKMTSAAFFNPEIGEVEPIMPRKLPQLGEECRLNLVVPSINREHVFGGIATAVRFYQELAAVMGVRTRILVANSEINAKTAEHFEGHQLVSAGEDSLAEHQVVDFYRRAGKTIPVGKNDLFIATGWWTAYTLYPVLRWQAEAYGTQPRPLIYLIQDYEPGFYPWSSRYLMAESTYQEETPTVAVFNSSQLRDYFHQNGYTFFREYSFDPVLNSGLKKLLPTERTTARDKQIFVYGRPSTERNAFPLIVAALREWCRRNESAGEWRVVSAGEPHPNVALSRGVELQSLGKLSLEEYARQMARSYAGISLMVSPHPSYPPLEMSTFGIKTITNCYANKDLSTFNGNIISLRSCSGEALATALSEVCAAYDGVGRICTEGPYLRGEDAFSGIIAQLGPMLKEMCEGESAPPQS